ncbi:hypothetical protein AYI68_g5615, partial [Smittium mucronatum]
MQSTNRKT